MGYSDGVSESECNLLDISVWKLAVIAAALTADLRGRLNKICINIGCKG